MRKSKIARRCALVTGSTRGIGQAIAKELAKEGINIAVNGRGLEESAEKTIHICREHGVETYFFRADISNSKSRKELVESIKQKLGRLDILVNNAGVAPKERKDILETAEESFDRVLGINLKGPYFLTQLISKWMIEQKTSHPERDFLIVNISSVSSYAASLNRGEYCISKAGMSMMTKLYAARLAGYGINVYEIRPGIISTDMTSRAKDNYDKLFREGLLPINRWGQPEDVGKAVAGLVKGHLKYSTGDVINVDGGFHIQRL
ncbi:3-ketoacyl-ACP reductase [Candidatus Aerophobetes bacterium]|nr:3-ketoacyl-ACP reductase [Candidatus Aerophobetes bacterium]